MRSYVTTEGVLERLSETNKRDEEKQEPGDVHDIKIPDKGIETLSSPLRPFVDEKSGYVVLGRSGSAHKKWRRKGLLQVGAVNEHQELGVDLFGKEVFIDAAFPHIIFICGKRGSGKSYTLGIFAEELLRSSIGVGVILVDPIGIFWSLKIENSSRSEKRGLEKWNLSPTSFPEVKVLAPGDDPDLIGNNCDGPFTIGVNEMTAEDWCQVFDMERFKTQGLLIGTAIDLVRKGYNSLVDDMIVEIPPRPDSFSIGDIIQCMETSTSIISKTGGFNPQTRRSLIARFRAAAGWGIFSVEGTPLRELTSPNRLTVLDVSDTKLGDAKRSLITGIIARKILSGRIHTSRMEDHKGYDDDDPNHIPLTWLLIDEAHIILPHGRQTPATEALVEYAKQGRRPGCALILATQRPASTSDEILSQVDLLIGHNLALEDDMTALRRRVPAKLPPEFAVSDFIRGIPVGTAVVADQKTQQRSFLIKLRPRLSHHAGSSAMPKAFQDKRPVKRKIPITATHVPKNRHPVLEPTPIAVIPDETIESIEEEEDETHGIIIDDDVAVAIPESPLPDIPWGSTVMLKERTKEDLEMFLGNIESSGRLLLILPDHMSDIELPSEMKEVQNIWMTEKGNDGSVSFSSPQRILEISEPVLSSKTPWTIVLDGLEELLIKNDPQKVKDLLESFYARAYEGKHLLVVRTAEEVKEGLLDGFMDDTGHIEDMGEEDIPDIESTYGEDQEANDTNGSLSSDDLKWMCNVMDLPTTGNETDLLDRLIEVEKESIIEEDDAETGMDVIKHVVQGSSHARGENERLREKIEELENEVGVGTERKKGMPLKNKASKRDKRLVLVWEDDEEKEQKYNDLMEEVEYLRDEVDSEKMVETTTSSQIIESPLNKILEMIELERKENLNRLNRLEEVLQNEMESLRGQIREQRKEPMPPKRNIKLRVVKEKPSIPVWGPPRQVKRMKKRVIKKGEEVTVITPKVGVNSALEIAKRNLKRSLLKGPRETIEDVVPYYMPLYRFLVSFKGGLMRSVKEGDVYFDAITGEVVEQGRNGLRRSRGLRELLKVTDLEMLVLANLSKTARDPTWISKSSKIDLSRTKRTLTALEKKGIVVKIRKEANMDLFALTEKLRLPSRPWTRDHGFEPHFAAPVQEKVLDPILSVKDAHRLMEQIGPDLEILEQDMVRYPIYIATIRGEGRTRYIAIDGIGGRLDRDISTIAKTIIPSGP